MSRIKGKKEGEKNTVSFPERRKKEVIGVVPWREGRGGKKTKTSSSPRYRKKGRFYVGEELALSDSVGEGKGGLFARASMRKRKTAYFSRGGKNEHMIPYFSERRSGGTACFVEIGGRIASLITKLKLRKIAR